MDLTDAPLTAAEARVLLSERGLLLADKCSDYYDDTGRYAEIVSMDCGCEWRRWQEADAGGVFWDAKWTRVCELHKEASEITRRTHGR